VRASFTWTSVAAASRSPRGDGRFHSPHRRLPVSSRLPEPRATCRQRCGSDGHADNGDLAPGERVLCTYQPVAGHHRYGDRVTVRAVDVRRLRRGESDRPPSDTPTRSRRGQPCVFESPLRALRGLRRHLRGDARGVRMSIAERPARSSPDTSTAAIQRRPSVACRVRNGARSVTRCACRARNAS
jgi:hypothetical protein